jgi:hypothetical protein
MAAGVNTDGPVADMMFGLVILVNELHDNPVGPVPTYVRVDVPVALPEPLKNSTCVGVPV